MIFFVIIYIFGKKKALQKFSFKNLSFGGKGGGGGRGEK
jgi:hypothetical protein